jgi:hypothetical protein
VPTRCGRYAFQSPLPVAPGVVCQTLISPLMGRGQKNFLIEQTAIGLRKHVVDEQSPPHYTRHRYIDHRSCQDKSSAHFRPQRPNSSRPRWRRPPRLRDRAPSRGADRWPNTSWPPVPSIARASLCLRVDWLRSSIPVKIPRSTTNVDATTASHLRDASLLAPKRTVSPIFFVLLVPKTS